MSIIGIDLVGALGPPLDPQGAPGDPPWPPPRGPYVHEGLPRTAQRLPSTCRPSLFRSFGRPRPLQRTRLSRKSIETNFCFNDFQIETSAALYYFYSIWAPKGTSRTIFGEAGDSFRHPCLPRGLFQSLLGAHGARRGPLRLDHH